MPRKSHRNPAKPALPAQLRRNAALRGPVKPGAIRPASRKAPANRRPGGHRG